MIIYKIPDKKTAKLNNHKVFFIVFSHNARQIKLLDSLTE